MIMLTLIRGYDSFGVGWSSLNMLTHVASCTCAFVITPVHTNSVPNKLQVLQNIIHSRLTNNTGYRIVFRLKEWVTVSSYTLTKETDMHQKMRTHYLQGNKRKKHFLSNIIHFSEGWGHGNKTWILMLRLSHGKKKIAIMNTEIQRLITQLKWCW